MAQPKPSEIARLRAEVERLQAELDKRAPIPVTERMPEPDMPVLIAVRRSNGTTRRLRASYAPPKTLPVGFEMHADDFGEYDEETDEYYCPEGWYEHNEYDDVHWAVEGEVTHWWELPPFPETRRKP